MLKFLRLLRLEYSISWLLFYFAGLIYLKSIYSINKLDIMFIIGSLFLTASVNVHNYLCDGNLRGHKKNFFALIVIFFILGMAAFPNIFLLLAAVVVYLYNWKLKKILYLSILCMVVPGLAVLAVLQIYDPLVIASVILISLTIQSGHQLIDGDIKNKNYFYIYVISFPIASLLTSMVLYKIDAPLAWAAFIMTTTLSYNAVSLIKNVDAGIKSMRSIGRHTRNSIILIYWILLIFLAGWYFLITL